MYVYRDLGKLLQVRFPQRGQKTVSLPMNELQCLQYFPEGFPGAKPE